MSWLLLICYIFTLYLTDWSAYDPSGHINIMICSKCVRNTSGCVGAVLLYCVLIRGVWCLCVSLGFNGVLFKLNRWNSSSVGGLFLFSSPPWASFFSSLPPSLILPSPPLSLQNVWIGQLVSLTSCILRHMSSMSLSCSCGLKVRHDGATVEQEQQRDTVGAARRPWMILTGTNLIFSMLFSRRPKNCLY